MTIVEVLKQGFHYARRCKSLWLFGFVVGLASSGSSGAGNSGGGGGGLALPFLLPPTYAVALVLAAVALVIAALVLRFISEGALIEGVIRTRLGGTMTLREGFVAGLAHWGVLLRIELLYIAATVGSLIVFILPCVVVAWTFGAMGAIAIAIPSLLVAVPWLLTLYLLQAFASRIAVVENRHAREAIAKARLFLHGRLAHGLKLTVAMLIGTFAIGMAGALAIFPVVLALVVLIRVVQVVPLLIAGAVIILPLAFVVIAMMGTFRSSIWTIGYVTQVES